MKKKAIILIACFCLLAAVRPAPAAADWVKAWMNDTVSNYTGPSYYDAGKRGYASFGSFSTRMYMTNDRLATFTPPRIRFGCGGIDALTGGFSFLNFKYLVQQKLQRIISAAPAFAFEYALRSISSQAGTIMDDLEGFSDMLNSLQLNDCQAAQKLGYMMAHPKNTYAGLKSEVAKVKTTIGDSSNYYDALQALWSNKGQITASVAKALNGECPADIINVLNDKSLVHHIAGSVSSLEGVVRGFIGDVRFSKGKDGFWHASVLPACDVSKTGSFKALVDGTGSANFSPTSLKCQKFTGTPLKDVVAQDIIGIYNAMKTRSPLTSEQKNLLRFIPMSIQTYLKQLYIYDAPPQAAEIVAEPAAYGFGFSLLSSIYAIIDRAILLFEQTTEKECSISTTGKQCRLCQHNGEVSDSLTEFRNGLHRKIDNAYKLWTATQSEMQAATQTLNVLKAVNAQAIRNRVER